MDLKLKELRKQAGYRNRDDFAEEIGVNKFTYRSWETGAALMNLEQAFMCAEALGCTIDEIAGIDPPEVRYRDRRQQELNDCWAAMGDERRERLLGTARDYAAAESRERVPLAAIPPGGRRAG